MIPGSRDFLDRVWTYVHRKMLWPGIDPRL
jgi:hypothetical protein